MSRWPRGSSTAVAATAGAVERKRGTASRKARTFRANPTQTVRASPIAGSRMKPAASVPKAAPSVFTV